MESKRFDDIAKSVASLASRRSVVKGMVGGAFAGLIGLRGADAAKKRAEGQTCRNQAECETGLICIVGSDGRRRCDSCEEGSICGNGCCVTYCSPDVGCTDAYTEPQCYFECLDYACYSSNFNYTFNNHDSCEAYCQDVCDFPI